MIVFKVKVARSCFLMLGYHKGLPEPRLYYRDVCYTAASNEAVQGLNITGMGTTGM